MTPLTENQDAYGAAMYDFFRGHGGFEIIERQDGFVAPSSGPSGYMAPYEDWPKRQRQAIRLARGSVLDVGCGCGRVALYLQRKDLAVTAIDISPLAIRVCRARGVRKARVLPIEDIGPGLGRFDTVVMYGNNFGLFGSSGKARRLLRRLCAMTGPRARILAESNDPYPRRNAAGRIAPAMRCHLQYHRVNRRRGRMPGQLRIRVRYLTKATPWFDYLFVSKEEMREIVDGTGWRVARFFDSDGPQYVAVLEKEKALERRDAGPRARPN